MGHYNVAAQFPVFRLVDASGFGLATGFLLAMALGPFDVSPNHAWMIAVSVSASGGHPKMF